MGFQYCTFFDRLDYMDFIRTFAKGIRGHSPIIIYEPDALPHTTFMEPEDSKFRIELMQ